MSAPVATPSPGRVGRLGRLGRPLLLLLTAGLVLVVTLGVGVVLLLMPSGDTTQWAAPTSASSVATQGPPPTRLKIPKIAVDSGLERLVLDAEGELEAPKDFQQAGWYADGGSPGDIGPAVIAGHVDSKSGPAVFFRLHELGVGDTIEVERAGETVKFRVTALRRYPKNEFPTDSVHGPTPNPQLRLITCGGAFDQERRSYQDNIVVFAVLA